MATIKGKFIPLLEKTYLLTDQCFWEGKPEGYNPTDPKRTPHTITLIDQDTGTIVLLKSGSTIKVVKAR